MGWTTFDTWIVVTGALVAVACGLLGAFLVLRRMSMLGDAISHAVLPGLAAAFLLTDRRDSATMFIGAVVVGILTAVLVEAVHRWGRVSSGASMGVVFTTLFAVGLVLIVRAASRVDLDPGCVLYGQLELTPADTVDVLGLHAPRAAIVMGACLLLNAAFVVVFYKELKITSFDPALATTLGLRANIVHYVLMALVAATAVAAFESVGSILVVAMLIVPAATAHLLTDRLAPMLLVTVALAAAAAVLGHVMAITVPPWFGYPDTGTAGAMAVAAGGLFTAAFLLAPRHGVLSRLVIRARLSLRIAQEDVLGLLYRRAEQADTALSDVTANVDDVRRALPFGPLVARAALRTLAWRGLVARADGAFRITPAGSTRAEDLVRAHRLWEAYLVEHMDIPPDHVHPTAMRLEHVTGRAMRADLAAEARHPRTDPHGRPIPGVDDEADHP